MLQENRLSLENRIGLVNVHSNSNPQRNIKVLRIFRMNENQRCNIPLLREVHDLSFGHRVQRSFV